MTPSPVAGEVRRGVRVARTRRLPMCPSGPLGRARARSKDGARAGIWGLPVWAGAHGAVCAVAVQGGRGRFRGTTAKT